MWPDPEVIHSIMTATKTGNLRLCIPVLPSLENRRLLLLFFSSIPQEGEDHLKGGGEIADSCKPPPPFCFPIPLNTSFHEKFADSISRKFVHLLHKTRLTSTVALIRYFARPISWNESITNWTEFPKFIPR